MRLMLSPTFDLSSSRTPFEEYANNAFTATHEVSDVDFITIHTWPQVPTP